MEFIPYHRLEILVMVVLEEVLDIVIHQVAERLIKVIMEVVEQVATLMHKVAVVVLDRLDKQVQEAKMEMAVAA